MYRIEADGYIVYQPGDSLFSVPATTLDEELGLAAAFTFDIRPENPMYNKLTPLKTRITVYDGGVLIFSGLIFEISKIGTDRTKTVQALDDLAALGLTQYAQGMGSSAPVHGALSPAQVFQAAISCHAYEASGILPPVRKGNITAADLPATVTIDTAARSNIDAVREMADSYGGYLRLRDIGSAAGPYLDWLKLEDCQTGSDEDIQLVRFGENLREYERSETFDDYFTCLLPLGAVNSETGQRLTIGSPGVPPILGGPDSLGRIKYAAKVWDDVTDVTELQTLAQAWYTSHCKKDRITVSISAADLSALGTGAKAWRLGDRARIIAEPYGVDVIMPVMKIQTDLLRPQERQITFSTASELRNRDTYTASVEDRITEAARESFTDQLYAKADSLKDAAGVSALESRAESMGQDLEGLKTELGSLGTDLEGLKQQIEQGGGGCTCPDWTQDINDIKSRLEELEKKNILDDLVGMVVEPVVFIDATQFELSGSYSDAETGKNNGQGYFMVKAKLARFEEDGAPVYRWEWWIRAKSAKYIDTQTINYLADVFSPRLRIPLGQNKYLLFGDDSNYADAPGESSMDAEFMENGGPSAIDSLVGIFSGVSVMYQPAETNGLLSSMVQDKDKDRYPAAENYYQAKARPAQYGWETLFRGHPYRANPYYGISDCRLDWHFYTAAVISENPSKLGTTDWEVSTE